MDTITHTLFGLSQYQTIQREKMTKEQKRAYLFSSLVGSQIPDIDVISNWWDTEGMYQMWHRGITHSIFLTPIWALLIVLVCYFLWKVKSWNLYFYTLIAVCIHTTSDTLNSWGTGYFEPFSDIRLTFGFIPIVDVVFWFVMLSGFLCLKLTNIKAHVLFKWVWVCIIFHIGFQAYQGIALKEHVKEIGEKQGIMYEKLELAPGFIPGEFRVVAKDKGIVDIYNKKGIHKSEVTLVNRFVSKENVDLGYLFETNPKAKTLYKWSPIVVVEETENEIILFDPRFYQNGSSFLTESAKK